jgi:hypothetical protein
MVGSAVGVSSNADGSHDVDGDGSMEMDVDED